MAKSNLKVETFTEIDIKMNPIESPNECQNIVKDETRTENSNEELKFSDCFVKVAKIKSKTINKIIAVKNYNLLDAQNQADKIQDLANPQNYLNEKECFIDKAKRKN